MSGRDNAVANAGAQPAPLQVEEVLACSFDRWYTDFADVTFASRIIPLSEDVVKYLQADGVQVPQPAPRDGEAADSDSEWGDGGSDSDDDAGRPDFPELEDAITSAIKDLGGAVLPKLNWSAPKDARWLLGTLRCDSLQEVLMLLKASDFVAHDLRHGFDHCENGGGGRTRPETFSLVLREWKTVEESSEFRCFVHDGLLRAVSQRHSSLFFEHLVDPRFTESVARKLQAFFEERVQGTFPIHRYAFDVVVGKAPGRKITLVDFSPWGGSTDPLLYDWDELETPDRNPQALPEVRIVQSEMEKRAKVENYHSLPLEVAELGAHSSEELESLFRRAEATIGVQ